MIAPFNYANILSNKYCFRLYYLKNTCRSEFSLLLLMSPLIAILILLKTANLAASEQVPVFRFICKMLVINLQHRSREVSVKPFWIQKMNTHQRIIFHKLSFNFPKFLSKMLQNSKSKCNIFLKHFKRVTDLVFCRR